MYTYIGLILLSALIIIKFIFPALANGNLNNVYKDVKYIEEDEDEDEDEECEKEHKYKNDYNNNIPKMQDDFDDSSLREMNRDFSLSSEKTPKNIDMDLVMDMPYKPTTSIMSKSERMLYIILDKYLGSEYKILIKPRLLDLMVLNNSRRQNQAWFNKVCSKHIDFVLCDKTYFRPIAAIELDDSSHNRKDRIERDNFVDNVMHRIRINMFHIKVGTNFNREVKHISHILRELDHEYINR